MRTLLVIVFLCFCFVSAQEKTSYTPEKNDAVFIITANGSIFDQARNELVNELRDEFSVSIGEINETATVEEIAALFNANGIPKAVVLIGNNSIRMYLKYSSQHKEKTANIQVVTILALDVQRAVSGIPNVNAIAYETPMVTALVNFRRVLNRPIDKVGVVYRKAYQEFVEKQSRYCRKENIEIKGLEIGDDVGKHQIEITEALKTFLKKDPVDALWILNDNILLKPELLGSVWLPALKKNKAPLIVGVEALVNPKLNFGTFAVIPDPVALGEQAAEIIFDLKFDDWNHSGVMIHPAISTYSVLNVKKATEFTDLNNLKTFEVSKVLN
ncbi:MAG TPA: hypothetical protein VKO63_02485 [Chitinispirillaceae bacterium]|nr:hypothetical protein [Chitinispirillaceae bacterium]